MLGPFTIILLLLFICYFEQCCSTCILYNLLLSSPSWQISLVSEILIIHLTLSVLNFTGTNGLENNTLSMKNSVILTDLDQINLTYCNKRSDDTSSKNILD